LDVAVSMTGLVVEAAEREGNIEFGNMGTSKVGDWLEAAGSEIRAGAGAGVGTCCCRVETHGSACRTVGGEILLGCCLTGIGARTVFGRGRLRKAGINKSKPKNEIRYIPNPIPSRISRIAKPKRSRFNA
jgi:hypothetical protein